MVIQQKHCCPLALLSHHIRNCIDRIFIMKSDSLNREQWPFNFYLGNTTFLKSQELYSQVPIIRSGDKVVISRAGQQKGLGSLALPSAPSLILAALPSENPNVIHRLASPGSGNRAGQESRDCLGSREVFMPEKGVTVTDGQRATRTEPISFIRC